ncbi:predicted protein [Lichtheimia corymbifera JMRC:FSU:9682]|uniref:Uncharacterized protein n=1 Tax=Lichtheimia corymbifera JMRC:FSU:9682 TaxID=1263082 RepID=A0A068RSW1_9FUNG|nr:predicted protein [Lichtheimia corymbifera JMRC:FSU:9682]
MSLLLQISLLFWLMHNQIAAPFRYHHANTRPFFFNMSDLLLVFRTCKAIFPSFSLGTSYDIKPAKHVAVRSRESSEGPPTQHYMLLFSPSYKNQGGVVYIRFVVALQGEAFPLLDSTCWMIVPLTVTRYRSTLDCFTAAAQYGWDGGGAVIGSKYAIENTQGHLPACITYQWIMSTRSDSIDRFLSEPSSLTPASCVSGYCQLPRGASCNERLLSVDHISNEQQAATLFFLVSASFISSSFGLRYQATAGAFDEHPGTNLCYHRIISAASNNVAFWCHHLLVVFVISIPFNNIL